MPSCRSQHAGNSNTPEAGHLTANGQQGRWEAALGNIEDARVAVDMYVAQPRFVCAMLSEDRSVNLRQGFRDQQRGLETTLHLSFGTTERDNPP